jgi:DNA-binding Xre family transcriptional regulator
MTITLSRDRVRNICGEIGITQRVLAERLGMSEANLSSRINGHIPTSMKWLGRMCRALDCLPGDLLSIEIGGLDDKSTKKTT